MSVSIGGFRLVEAMASANVMGNEKETKRNSIDGDIISNLPGDIIDNILIRLPIEEAARTSVLSTKWRFKWLSISQLLFDFDNNELFHSISSTSPKKIWCMIYNILLLHRGPLRKLLIHVDEELEDGGSVLNQIILLLTGKDIQHLTLYTPYIEMEDTKYTLPSTLFRCTYLTHLDLFCCIFRPPLEYFGFSKLINVRLFLVDFDANHFKIFLSKCPLLQRLHLVRCKKGSVEIDAPNLKVLCFDCPKMSILLKNAPLLSILEIKSSARGLGGSSNTVNMFASLPALALFSAHGNFLMDLTAGVVPERLPAMLNELEYVELNGLRFNSSKEVQIALLMIRSSPNLRKLQIRLEEYDDNIDDVPIESLFLVEDSFNKLCEIEMEDLKGTVCQLEFMEFLLAKSTALKKIRIQPSKKISDERVARILKAVTEFKRASPEAQIVFCLSSRFLS